jgi:hypothetical protein
MKVEINQVLQGLDEPLKDEKGQNLTLRMVAINSILRPVQGDDEKVKVHKFEVYEKLRDNVKEVELSIEDWNLIKRCVGTIQPQLIVGQVFKMIENNKLTVKK